MVKKQKASCCENIRGSGLLATAYDNINMMFKVAEQILERKDTQNNGTRATVFKLHCANPADIKTILDLVDSYIKALPLSVDDVLLSPLKNALLTERFARCVLRVITMYGDA